LVQIVELPSGYDPDSFVREHGAEAMSTRLREAPGYIGFMKLLVDRRAGELAVKERAIRHVLDDVARVSDPVLKELYSKELCRAFGLSESAVQEALESRKSRGTPAERPAEPQSAGVSEEEEGSTAVREARRGLLRLALSSGAWGEKLVQELDATDFGQGLSSRIFVALQTAGRNGRWRDHVTTSEDDSFGSALEFEGPPAGDPEQLFRDYRATLLEARLDRTGAALRRRLAEAEERGDQETLSRLLAEQQALARDRSELRRPPSGS
jgi:DNA primase